ncbi:hypothetical protein M2360_000530 [Rhizobium sp. SG_E_25_P2]|nr:hypothetical protein [Rhizobium sp. SG_E_25_P2]
MRLCAARVMMAADQEQGENKRRAPRLRALKAGRIVFHHGGSTIDCTIRNLSATGAKIALEQALLAPDVFDLQFQDGTMRPCTVRWRKLTEIGVSFDDG